MVRLGLFMVVTGVKVRFDGPLKSAKKTREPFAIILVLDILVH